MSLFSRRCSASRVARTLAQGPRLLGPGALVVELVAQHGVLERGDLVALHERGRGDALLAGGQAAQPRGLGRHGGALGLDRADGGHVPVLDAAQALDAVEQVAESVGGEDHPDGVRRRRLVVGDELGPQRLEVLLQLGAQDGQVRARRAQLGLELAQLPALVVEAGLDAGQALEQVVDPALEAVDPDRVRVDRAVQRALAALGARDLALQAVGRRRRGCGRGDERSSQGERDEQ